MEGRDADPRAPMAAAPMKYQPDGSVDWGNMWDSFCVLARDGGPPHRGNMLQAQEHADITGDSYQFAAAEICRGITAVCGLPAEPATAGWLMVHCHSPGMARWLAESIEQENVQSRAEEARLFVPVGDSFTLKGEIKNVITAVAKTTHYWHEHLPSDAKRAVEVQARLARLGMRLKRWLCRGSADRDLPASI
jgi:sirohydrochlorin cobaltochelatase